MVMSFDDSTTVTPMLEKKTPELLLAELTPSPRMTMAPAPAFLMVVDADEV